MMKQKGAAPARFRTIERYSIGRHVFNIQEQNCTFYRCKIPSHFRVHHQYLSPRLAIGQFIAENMDTTDGCRMAILLFLSRSKRRKAR